MAAPNHPSPGFDGPSDAAQRPPLSLTSAVTLPLPGSPAPPPMAQIGADTDPGGDAGGTKLFAIRGFNYLTNHVVSHIPSFAIRRWWYERLLGIRCGEGVAIHMGCFLWSYTPRNVRRAGISFGDYCYINRNCCIDIRGPLTIGSNVSISPEVTILTATHGVDDPAFQVRHYPVVIEDYVWIGTRAMILPGVTLGRGCVVAAGAVVTRDVEPLEIVAGVPARAVGTRDASATAYRLQAPLPLFE